MYADSLTGIRACVFDAYGTLFDCKNARNFDPTPEVSQRIDLVAKDWN